MINQWLKVWVLVLLSMSIAFSQISLPDNTPKEVECIFKFTSTIGYSNIDKAFSGNG